MVHFWRKNSNPISIFEYFRRFSWNKFAIFFSVLKEWHFNLQKVSLLMMNHWKNHWKQFWCLTMFITSGAKICQYVYCCLRWFWHGSHQSLLWTKRWAHPPIFFIVLFRIPCTKNVLSSTLLKRRKGGCCEKKTIACLDGGGASELSKVTFQTDPCLDQKKNSTILWRSQMWSRKEPEIEGIKIVVHLALLISSLILVLLVSLWHCCIVVKWPHLKSLCA